MTKLKGPTRGKIGGRMDRSQRVSRRAVIDSIERPKRMDAGTLVVAAEMLFARGNELVAAGKVQAAIGGAKATAISRATLGAANECKRFAKRLLRNAYQLQAAREQKP